jgi:SAM-dependent methyltransferase
MVLPSYDLVLRINQEIYSKYAEEYTARTKDGHQNYLQDFIDEFISSLSGKVVIDLGCGPGRDLAYFKKCGLLSNGIDCSEKMVEMCLNRGLPAIKTDFLNFSMEDHSVDGLWAYTSHTIIPKDIFKNLMEKYKRILKKDTGILALGMIEGQFEGWKKDHKYEGNKRFVSRYSTAELESVLNKYFGSVWSYRVPVGNKVYLHYLCKNTKPARRQEIANAAKSLFNRFSDTYRDRTKTGIYLLKTDREYFVNAISNYHTSSYRIIDIGCGPGRDAKIISGYGLDVVGLDLSKANIKNCNRMGLNGIVGDFYDIDKLFEQNTFNGAWCNCSITNWLIKADLHIIIDKIKHITKAGGIIFTGSVLGSFRGWEVDHKYNGMKRYNNHWLEYELKSYLKSFGELLYERKLLNTGNKDYINLIYRNEK